jgi:polyvinyl alcohol dehydrogenase (cytochrome)
VFEIDRGTGRRLWSTLVDTDPNAQVTGSPAVYGGVAYVGISSKGEGTRRTAARVIQKDCK